MEHWAENLTHARIPLHSSRLRQIQNLYMRFSLPLTDSSLFHLWKTGYSNFAQVLEGTTTKSTRQRWSVFPHKFKLPRTEGRLVDYTIYCYVLPWSWLSPVHVIHWFHVRRIPDPWLHIAYLIVLWFSHALSGRKLVWSVCPQLCKLLRVTSIICSQARTTAIARWSPSLLFQTRLWTPVTHLHLPSQHPKLGVRPYSHSSKCASTLCPFCLFWREKVSCRTSWLWLTLRGQKDTERDTRTEHEVLKEGGIGEICVKERKGKQLAGDVDQRSKGLGQCKLVPAPLLHPRTGSMHVSASHLAEVTPGGTWGHLTLPILPWNIRLQVLKGVIFW